MGTRLKGTFDADNNTVTNLAHGAEVDEPSSGVHGATGSIVGTTDTQTLTNKTLTSPVLNTSVSGTAVLDEDNMASDSATQLATQQSIKAYVDTQITDLAVANYSSVDTIDVADKVVLADASGGAFTLTLYAASGNSGKVIRIKKTDSSANAVTIDGNASETIDGATTLDLELENEAVQIACDGSNWYILSHDAPEAKGTKWYLAANQTGNVGETTVGFDTESKTVGTAVTYSTSTDRFTFNEAGWYTITAGLKVNSLGVSEYRQIRVIKNGSTALTEFFDFTSVATNGLIETSITDYFAATDYIQIKGQSTSDDDFLLGLQNTWCSAVKVRG